MMRARRVTRSDPMGLPSNDTEKGPVHSEDQSHQETQLTEDLQTNESLWQGGAESMMMLEKELDAVPEVTEDDGQKEESGQNAEVT